MTLPSWSPPSRGGHVHHQLSIARLGVANKKQSVCGLHSLLEVYAVMTALPVKPMIPPEQAFLFVEEVRKRLTPVSLSSHGNPENRRRRFQRRTSLRRPAVGLRCESQGTNYLYLESEALSGHRAGTRRRFPCPLTSGCSTSLPFCFPARATIRTLGRTHARQCTSSR